MSLLSVMSQVKLVSFNSSSSSSSNNKNNNIHIPILRNFRGSGSTGQVMSLLSAIISHVKIGEFKPTLENYHFKK